MPVRIPRLILQILSSPPCEISRSWTNISDVADKDEGQVETTIGWGFNDSANLLLRLSMSGSYIEFRERAELHSTAAIADV